MPSAAICDNEPLITKELAGMVKNFLPDWSVSCFLSGEEMLSAGKMFDIVILDIRMEKTDGMETAKILRERDPDAVIIFITGAAEYVFKAFDVGAFHYLLKPIDEKKFKEVLTRAASEVNKRAESSTLLIKTRDKSVLLNVKEITYLENSMRKIVVHTVTETYEFYSTMEKIERRLGSGFFRCHRGYLVNLAFISEYDSANIYLANGEKIYLSKDKYRDFVKCYMRFLKNNGASYE